jgi:alanine racemase
MSTTRNCWVELDLDVLRRNIASLRDTLPPATRIIFVVKADAYGHGMIPVARCAWECGLRWFAVAHVADALALRNLLPEAAILLTSAALPHQAAACAAANLKVLLVDRAHAEALAKEAGRAGCQLACHAKIDTGMGRLGFLWQTAADDLAWVTAALPALRMEGICTHFASSDDPSRAFLDTQVTRFQTVLRDCESRGVPLPFRHASNSGAIVSDPRLDLAAVRPGILLYGYGTNERSPGWPGRKGRFVHTEPFLHWKTRVLQVKHVPAGFTVSYDSTHVTPTPTDLATLDVGYSDGYSRLLSNRGQVLIRGRRCPVVGRVTMNLITVDAGADSGVKAGEEAVLMGRQGSEAIWADEIAQWCETIPYEVLTSIRARPLAPAGPP